MLPVTDQDTGPKGARNTRGASQQGVKYKPIPTDPRETPIIQRSQGTFGVSQTAGEAGKGEEKVGRGAGRQGLVGGSTGASGGTPCLWVGLAWACKLTTVF